mmetsp:Transcript_4980/g.6638  ORF Transcript_4980/g.6638 Transcript_4980/m.6638 type:complete len:84 (-) Transcript_4980:9-260(-)
MVDAARATFYLALASEGTPEQQSLGSECLSACQSIFETYMSPTPIQDYTTYREQAGYLAQVHQALTDTALLKLRCHMTVMGAG